MPHTTLLGTTAGYTLDGMGVDASTDRRRAFAARTTGDGPTVEDTAYGGAVDSPAPAARASTATANANDLAAGTVVGEYAIEGKLGEGGMGVVFAATHPVIGKRAAIKVLRPGLCEDEIAIARFIDEARAVNRIGHPNIVDVFAFGELADGRSYFVMEWLVGESLRTRAARGRLELDEVARIVIDVAIALEAAHDAGVIHRDLKPDNIFLVATKHGPPTVKLLDFGIAKLSGTDRIAANATATGEMIGTPQYMSPEQARGQSIDARTDIYSLGVMLFELLAGRPPFRATNAMDMIAQHLTEPAPPVRSLVDVPPFVGETVDAMLAKSADERPSLNVVRAVLERARLAGDAGRRRREKDAVTLAPPVGAPTPRRRRTGMVIGAVVGSVGLVAGLVLWRQQASTAPVAPTAPTAGATSVPPADARQLDARQPDARAPVDAAATADAAPVRPDGRPRSGGKHGGSDPGRNAGSGAGSGNKTGSGSGGTKLGNGLMPVTPPKPGVP